MSHSTQPALTDSAWFWVLAFSLMALLALAVIGGKYGKRQSIIERQYQARERVAEDLVARDRAANQIEPENSSAAAERIDNLEPRRPFATPGSKLIPLWPLATLLVVVAIVAALMLQRDYARPSEIPPEIL